MKSLSHTTLRIALAWIVLSILSLYPSSDAIAQAPAGYLHFPGKTIPGRNIANLAHQTPQSCAKACSANARCKSFDMDKRGNCWLQDANRSDVKLSGSTTYDYYERAGASSQTRGTEPTPAGYRCYSGKVLPGGNISSRPLRKQTRQSCANACNKNSKCRSFDISDGGDCYLQNVVGSAATLSNSSTYSYCEKDSRAPTPTTSDQALCRAYADSAVNQQRTNLGRRCGYRDGQGGVGWHTTFQTHFDWCMKVPAASSGSHTRTRADMLQRCGQSGTGTSTPTGYRCFRGKVLPGGNISARPLRKQTAQSCAAACNNNPKCKSFDLKNTGDCYLQNVDTITNFLSNNSVYVYCERRTPPPGPAQAIKTFSFDFSAYGNPQRPFPGYQGPWQLGPVTVRGAGVVRASDGALVGGGQVSISVDTPRGGQYTRHRVTAQVLRMTRIQNIGGGVEADLQVRVTSSRYGQICPVGTLGVVTLIANKARLPNGQTSDGLRTQFPSPFSRAPDGQAACRTHVHGFNNVDVPYTDPPRGGPPSGGNRAVVNLSANR
ncbi:MAG: PAN domain-containing protein [Burkholderiaceae bacterium]